MGDVITLPGVDPTQIHRAPSPRGRTLVIRERACGDFVLMIEPRQKQSGWLDGWVARRAQDARLRAGDLLYNFPRLFSGVIDKTGSTRPTAMEAMAAPFGGDAA